MIRWNWRRGTRSEPVTRMDIRYDLTPNDVVAALAASLVVEWEAPLPLPPQMSRTAITNTVRGRLFNRGDEYIGVGWSDDCNGNEHEIALAWAYQQFIAAWPEHAGHVTSWAKGYFDRGVLAEYAAEVSA